MRILLIPVLATALASTIAAQDVKQFLGRWDMTVTPATGKPYPQWMELTDTGGKIEGRIQPRGGAWHPIVGAKCNRASWSWLWGKRALVRKRTGRSHPRVQAS